jgi:hypothetical protein
LPLGIANNNHFFLRNTKGVSPYVCITKDLNKRIRWDTPKSNKI